MGEIKSTLDLVLARTKNLTLSEADKKEQSRNQFAARLNGLLQKVFDQSFRFEEFNRALADLAAEFAVDFRAPLVDALLQMIEPGKDNEMALGLLQNPAGVDSRSLQLVLKQFQEEFDTARLVHADRVKQALADKCLISGSAVFPNLDRDGRWNKTVAALLDQYNGRLASAKQKIGGAIDP